MSQTPFSKSIRPEQLSWPVREELAEFRSFFRDTIRSDVPLLDTLIRYLWRQKGKEIRPLLVFLSARLFGGIGRRSHIAATMVELLHTATLIHDDVVDEAGSRRGFLSINRLWRNKAGVLLGDYLLSKGLLVALENREYELLRILSDAVRQMSEGELRQLKTARLQNMTEERYFKIISEKTASLIAACCACGAESALGEGSGDRTEGVDRMRRAGLLIGVAFQIKDDLLDYGQGDIGKPKRNDIRERKVTLPLIKALQNADPSEAKPVLRLFQKRRKSGEQIEQIVRFVRENGGVESSEMAMKEQMEAALELIRDHPDRRPDRPEDGHTPFEDLSGLLRYITDRQA